MPSPRSYAVATAGTLALAGLLGGCGGSGEDPGTATPTSVADLDASALSPSRAPFCDQVPGAAVRAALGAEPTAQDLWNNGEPAPGTPADVAHELGCSWTGPDGAVARVWVFARPVDVAFAGGVVQDATERKGCRTSASATFGEPGLDQVCAVRAGTRVRYAGLFGSTWLSCELTATGAAPAVRARADAWCAAVATAVG